MTKTRLQKKCQQLHDRSPRGQKLFAAVRPTSSGFVARTVCEHFIAIVSLVSADVVAKIGDVKSIFKNDLVDNVPAGSNSAGSASG